MKIFLAVSLLLGIFSSCVSEDIETIEIIEEIDRTDDNILLKNLTPASFTEMGELGLLGYGYDVTGEYGDISGSKDRIFDLEKLLIHSPSSIYERPSYGSMGKTYASPDVENFLMALSRNKEATKGLSLFRGTITSYFPVEDALSSKFIIAGNSSYMGYSSVNFYPWQMEDYLTDAFQNNIENNSPEEIVAKYGTHYIISILFGHKLTIMYLAETDNIDREQAASLGLAVAMKNSFSLFSGDLDNIEASSAKGNFSQKVSYKVYGGDPSTIKEIPSKDGNPLRVNLNDWLKSCTAENTVMIDFDIFPIYMLVREPAKQAALQQYVEKYLAENQVKL